MFQKFFKLFQSKPKAEKTINHSATVADPVEPFDAVARKVIWIYWENHPGKTEPPHILLCRYILQLRSNCDVRLITPDNLHEYLPEIHPNIHKIRRDNKPDETCLAIKTGFIRVFLLEKFGGLYIDSDAVVLRDLGEVFDRIREKGFVSTRKTSKPRKHIPNNFLGSARNGRIMTIYANLLRKMLAEKTIYKWGEIGSRMLTEIVNDNPEHAHIYPEAHVHPLTNNQQAEYLSPEIEPADVISDEALIFMLFHRIFDGEIPKLGAGLKHHGLDDLYYGEFLLSKIFRGVLTESQYQDFRASLASTLDEPR